MFIEHKAVCGRENVAINAVICPHDSNNYERYVQSSHPKYFAVADSQFCSYLSWQQNSNHLMQ